MGWPNNFVQGVYDSSGNVIGIDDGDGGYINAPTKIALNNIIAHRGNSNCEVENSLSAMKSAYANGFINIDAGDYQVTSDGVAVCMHDTTVDRTTDGTGAVSGLTLAQFKVLKLDYGSVGLFGSGYDLETPPTLAEVIDYFIDTPATIWIEPKSTAAMNAVLVELKRYNYPAHKVVINSFNESDLFIAQSYGYPTMLLISGLGAAYNKNGHTYLGSDTWDASNVTIAKNKGFKTVVYTIKRRYLAQQYAAMGVEYITTDDPKYISEKFKDTSRIFGSKWDYGMVGYKLGDEVAHRGNMTATGWRFINDGFEDSIYKGSLQGWACPVVNSPTERDYTVTVNASLDTVVSDTRWLGILVGANSDSTFCDATPREHDAYFIVFRRNGTIDIFENTAGASPTVLTASYVGTPSNLTLGVFYDFTVQVKADRIIASVNGVTNTVMHSDTAKRGGYFHVGRNSAEITVKKITVA